jgi:hypothetical protein
MKHFSRKKLIFLSPLLIIAFAAFVFLFGWVVMLLWNAVMVPVAGAGIITFWQALGLLVLSRILVGGFGGRGRGYRRENNWRGRWMNMSEEERTAFQQNWKNRCGGRYSEAPTENETSGSK